LRRLYERLRLRINEDKSAVGKSLDRKFLGFSFWVAPGRTVKRRVADKALAALKQRVREITARSGGRSIGQVTERLRGYLVGWKGYFQLADTPGIFRDLDAWIRHRLRVIHLKQWKRGRTTFRELRARGLSVTKAAYVAANTQRWWKNAGLYLHYALPNSYFDKLGVPRLAS
jgi:RNA-directed DNA polymerase